MQQFYMLKFHQDVCL